MQKENTTSKVWCSDDGVTYVRKEGEGEEVAEGVV